MTEANEYYAYFTVSGNFDPAYVTSVMEIEPTDAWKKGDRNERTLYERKFSRWSLYSRLPLTESIEKHIADVVEQLKPLSEAVRHLGAEFSVEVPVVAKFYQGYPGMHLGPHLLADLGQLGLGLDFDFYYMYSDKRADS